MWVRSVRWADDVDPARSFSGSFMPPAGDLLDTAELTADELRRRLPAAGADLADCGRLIVELVVEESPLPAELDAWLDLCAPVGSGLVREFVAMQQPLPAVYQAQVGAGGVVAASAHQRALTAVDFGFDARDPRRPCVVGRRLITLDSRHLLLVIWRGPSSFPALPRPRSEEPIGPPGFPGTVSPPREVSEAIERGVPEHVVQFAREWGGSGPAAFDRAVAAFDDGGATGPQAVAEAMLAFIATDLNAAAADGLANAHDHWEALLMQDLRGETSHDVDDPQHLAVLGGIARYLRDALSRASEPFDHEQRYWYARGDDSARIATELEAAETSLDRFNDRLRDSLALVAAVAAARTLRLQQRADQQSSRVEMAITVLGSLVLGPALIAGAFGANVPLPLGDTWWGTALMAALMLASVAAVWWFLTRRRILPGDGLDPRPRG